MDDETKQLLREIRDLQREHLELLRTNVKEATDVNRLAMENHTKWKQQSKHTTKWMLIIMAVVFVCMIVLQIMKKLR